jgi:hypothetical protein
MNFILQYEWSDKLVEVATSKNVSTTSDNKLEDNSIMCCVSP